MKSKLWIVMALILAVATAATTATAFAEPKKKHPPISQQVADSVHQSSQALLRLKVRALHNINQQMIADIAKVRPN